MSTKFRLIFKNSPFVPDANWDEITTIAMSDIIELGIQPAPAIAIAIAPLMIIHSTYLKLNPALLFKHNLSEEDITDLCWGYVYPLETIKSSAMCANILPNERKDFLRSLSIPTDHFDAESLQNRILEFLTGTINLLNIDPSGAQIFDYLTRYPFSKKDAFVNGFEIAKIIHSGISQSVAEKMPNLTWLNDFQPPTFC